MFNKQERKIKKQRKEAFKKVIYHADSSGYNEDDKVDAFRKDFEEFSHIDSSNDKLPYIIKYPTSQITDEMLFNLMITSRHIDKEKEAWYFSFLDDDYKLIYFTEILKKDDFKDRDLSGETYVLIDLSILHAAIKYGKVFDLFRIYYLGNNVRNEFIKYVIDNNEYYNFIENLESINYLLNTDDIKDYLKMIIDIKKTDVENNYMVHKGIKAVANHSMKQVDYEKIRQVILDINDPEIALYYIIYFKDFDIPNFLLLKACEASMSSSLDFSLLTIDDFKRLNDEQVKIILEYGNIGNIYNRLMYLGKYKKVLKPEVVKDLIDILLDRVNPSFTYENVKLNEDKSFCERYMLAIFEKEETILTLIHYLHDDIKNEYIDKFVDFLTKQEQLPYNLPCMKNIYNSINPIKVGAVYKITDKKINDKIINYLLGEGNEVDIEKVNRYKRTICDIKHLDDENILKIAPYYVNSNNIFVHSFMNFVSNITNIHIIENVVLNTNDVEIINRFKSLCESKTYSDDKLQANGYKK